MPKLRNKRTGVVVVVSEATATALGDAYEPVEREKPKRASRSTADKS